MEHASGSARHPHLRTDFISTDFIFDESEKHCCKRQKEFNLFSTEAAGTNVGKPDEQVRKTQP